MDLRRSNNVSIGLARFSRRGLQTQDVLNAVSAMDDKILNVEDLIMYQSLLPLPEEMKVIQRAVDEPQEDPTIPFAPAEAFMLETYNVPDLSLKVLAFIFKLQLPTESKDISLKLNEMIDLSVELRGSTHFKRLLKIVLELGNLTNYEYGAGNSSFRPWMGKEVKALGFKIEGLARLRDVKSADGKWSLMTFLVDMIQKNYPEVRFLAI